MTDISRSDYFLVIPEDVLALGPYVLAVYAALRKFADHRSDECWPSHQTLAQTAGVSMSKVKTVLADLRDAGWVTWEERRRSDGSSQSNLYSVRGHNTRGGSHETARGGSHEAAGGSHEAATELIPNELLPIDEHQTPGDAERLAALMSDLLTRIGVRHRVGKNWVRDIDRMIRLDGRTHDEIEGAMRWAMEHDFWRSNIHSPSSLRKHFDRMRLQAQRSQRASTDLFLQAAERMTS